MLVSFGLVRKKELLRGLLELNSAIAQQEGSQLASITGIAVQNYRSINDSVEIMFLSRDPAVLIGEDNAGKSNIVKAMELVLGKIWPGRCKPEAHELFGRVRGGRPGPPVLLAGPDPGIPSTNWGVSDPQLVVGHTGPKGRGLHLSVDMRERLQ